MTTDEKKRIKEEILRTLVQLQEQISKLEELTQPIAPDCSLGRLTRSEAMHEQQVNLRILDQARLKKQRLEHALGRIEDEMFGCCIECEEPIGIERMMIRPESVRCVQCASAL